jgi:RNA polymerase sigma factor (sigma-70 family)
LLPTSKHIQNIIDGCRKNNRQSQRHLYNWLEEYAVNICYRYATQITDVKDLVSDGFMKVYKNIEQFDDLKYGYNEATFKGWFKRVMINNCINYLKKHHTTFLVVDVEEYSTNDVFTNDSSVIDTISYKEIVNAVMQLPQSYKTVFCLFVIDGYSHDEIANELGINIGTSKSNLFKAKKQLKKILEY